MHVDSVRVLLKLIRPLIFDTCSGEAGESGSTGDAPYLSDRGAGGCAICPGLRQFNKAVVPSPVLTQSGEAAMMQLLFCKVSKPNPYFVAITE